jgi:hypothetical protein
MRYRAKPAVGIVLLTSSIYYAYGAAVNGFAVAVANGLSSAMGVCCAAPSGAEPVSGQWKAILLCILFIAAFVTAVTAGVGAFVGVEWLSKSIFLAGALGVGGCVFSLILWGFAGIAKYLFLAAAGYVLWSADKVVPVVGGSPAVVP